MQVVFFFFFNDAPITGRDASHGGDAYGHVWVIERRAPARRSFLSVGGNKRISDLIIEPVPFGQSPLLRARPVDEARRRGIGTAVRLTPAVAQVGRPPTSRVGGVACDWRILGYKNE